MKQVTCLQTDSAGKIYYTRSDLVSVDEVQCTLPVSPLQQNAISPFYSWTVAISNDNKTFSNDKQLWVYDSICMQCPTDQTSICQQKVTITLQKAGRFAGGAHTKLPDCRGMLSIVSIIIPISISSNPFCARNWSHLYFIDNARHS